MINILTLCHVTVSHLYILTFYMEKLGHKKFVIFM